MITAHDANEVINWVFTGIFITFITLIIFLLLRQFNNWYFKINERVELMKESNANQKKIIELLDNLETK